MNDDQLVNLAEQIYNQMDGSDDKRHHAELVQEIYEWLAAGDHVEEYTVKQLVDEWDEYTHQQ